MTPDEVAAALAARTPWRERLRAVLDASGATSTANQGLHSWRCEYPDSYGDGPCDCVDLLLDDLLNLIEPLWRVAEAAQAQERLTRQFVSMFGGTGRDERTILAALDTLREALAALAATQEETT